MSGLLLIGVAIIWLIVVIAITLWLAGRFKSWPLRMVSAVVVFPILLVAPLADELIGKHQFESLCERNGRHEADFAAIADKTLLVTNSNYEPVGGTILETMALKQTYSDPASGKQLLMFYGYQSKGGWLMRMLGISETGAPLLFDSSCGPFGDESVQGWLDRYHIKAVFRKQE